MRRLPASACALAALPLAPATAERPRLHAPELAQAADAAALSPAARKAVAGRRAGASVDCIDQSRPIAVRVVDRSAILWRTSPRRWYLNQPPRGCGSLRGDRTIVTRTGGNRLCAGDMVRLLTPGGILAGQCRLGRFLPFTR